MALMHVVLSWESLCHTLVFIRQISWKNPSAVFNRLQYKALGPVVQSICNVCETLICKLVYLIIVFGEHGRYIGNINHIW